MTLGQRLREDERVGVAIRVKDMLSVAHLVLAVATAEGYLRNKGLRWKLEADHTL